MFLRAITLQSELIIGDVIQGEQEGLAADYTNEVGLPSEACFCTERKAYSCCLLSPPEFDSTSAKNNAGLKYILAGRFGGGEDEVDRKFTELNEKLKNSYGNRRFWLSSVVLSSIVHLVSLLYIIFLLHYNHVFSDELFITYLASGILALFTLVYAMITEHFKYKKVGSIIQVHFIDWKALGVRVKYHSMKEDHRTRNTTSSPYLKIWYKAGVEYESS